MLLIALRLAHGLIDPAAREERARDAMMRARLLRHNRQRIAIFRFRLVEEPRRPQRIAVERQHFGAVRVGGEEMFGLASRDGELGDAERRLDHTDARRSDSTGVVGRQCFLIGVERFDVPAVLEKQLRELKLDVGGIRRGLLRVNREAGRRHNRRDRDGSDAPLHDPSRSRVQGGYGEPAYKNRAEQRRREE